MVSISVVSILCSILLCAKFPSYLSCRSTVNMSCIHITICALHLCRCLKCQQVFFPVLLSKVWLLSILLQIRPLYMSFDYEKKWFPTIVLAIHFIYVVLVKFISCFSQFDIVPVGISITIYVPNTSFLT